MVTYKFTIFFNLVEKNSFTVKKISKCRENGIGRLRNGNFLRRPIHIERANLDSTFLFMLSRCMPFPGVFRLNREWRLFVLNFNRGASELFALELTSSLRSWRDAIAGERRSRHIPSRSLPATSVHVFATETKAFAREIPPATQAS